MIIRRYIGYKKSHVIVSLLSQDVVYILIHIVLEVWANTQKKNANLGRILNYSVACYVIRSDWFLTKIMPIKIFPMVISVSG